MEAKLQGEGRLINGPTHAVGLVVVPEEDNG